MVYVMGAEILEGLESAGRSALNEMTATMKTE